MSKQLATFLPVAVLIDIVAGVDGALDAPHILVSNIQVIQPFVRAILMTENVSHVGC